MWRWLCLFLGFAFKLHLLPKIFLKKRLEGEVLHRAGHQVITSLIAYASCSYFDPKKKNKNPLQREQFTLIWSKCRRQLLYSIITSLTSHLDSSKLEVLTCSRPSFCLCFRPRPFLSLLLSLVVLLAQIKSKLLIFDITGLFLLIKRRQHKWHSGQRLPLVIKLGR